DADAGVAVEVVLQVLAAAVDEEVFLLVDQLHDVPLADLVVGGHLDGQGRAGLGAEAAEDAAGEVDPEPPGVAASLLSFGRFHGDAVHGTGSGAKVAGHAALAAVRVA